MNNQLSSEDAVAAYGDRFEMVLAASQRARELKNGHMPKVDKGNHGFIVTALNEIEQGKYTRADFLKTVKLKKKGHRDEFDIT
jgi:DNA-directed RNA polymerase omega subunit